MSKTPVPNSSTLPGHLCNGRCKISAGVTCRNSEDIKQMAPTARACDCWLRTAVNSRLRTAVSVARRPNRLRDSGSNGRGRRAAFTHGDSARGAPVSSTNFHVASRPVAGLSLL